MCCFFFKSLCYPYFYDRFLVQPYTKLSALFWTEVDQKVVDATVDGIGKVFLNTGHATRDMQSGNLSTMLKWMVLGLIVLLSLAVMFALTAKS